MSYILDALKRADAERARGGVPTLHAQSIASPATKSGLITQQRAGLAIATALVLAAVAVAWWLWQPVQAPMPASAVSIAVVTPQPAAMPAAPVAPHAPAATPYDVAPLSNPAMAPTRAVAAMTTTPHPVAATKPKIFASNAEPALATPSKVKAVAVTPAAAVTLAPAPTLAPLLSELPEATRRQIPGMSITGAVYSDNPSQRLLLVNGLVLSQGGEVEPDLTVVEIRSNSSDFNFRGTRFRMGH